MIVSVHVDMRIGSIDAGYPTSCGEYALSMNEVIYLLEDAGFHVIKKIPYQQSFYIQAERL